MDDTMEYKKLYTKTGDKGETTLGDGMRVAKDDIRVETNGELDALNSWLGVVVSMLPEGDNRVGELKRVQRRLMEIMSVVASSHPEKRVPGMKEAIEAIERTVDKISDKRVFSFVLPGGTPVEAFLHVTRCKARTCERRLWALSRHYPVCEEIMVYMNRLSDYLFALAMERR